MNYERKGRSPFFPGQPVPHELFVGRAAEVDRIRRATRQVAAGKPQAVFIEGEYGIGKSSLAGFMRSSAEHDPRLLGFHVMLGAATSLREVGQESVRAVIDAVGGIPRSAVAGTIRDLLADYIKEISLVGVKINLEKLRSDAVDISSGYLPFLRSIYERGKEHYKGLTLILDDINGLTADPSFSRFLKDLVDRNALSREPLPLLLIVCGTSERRRQLIEQHQPIERIFEIAIIDPMTESEMREFFNRAFARVDMRVEDAAMAELCRYSRGLPKLMHLLGEAAYWIVPEDIVDLGTAREAVRAAVEDVGRKFVHPDLHRLVRGGEYQRILRKLGDSELDLVFKESAIAGDLDERERRKLTELLREMAHWKVVSFDEQTDAFSFRDRLTQIYLAMAAAFGTG